MSTPVYGGPASWRAAETSGYSGFLAVNGYLQTGPVAYSPPAATLIGHPFEIDLLGKGAASRSGNVFVFVYNFYFADGFAGFASAAAAVEHEYGLFLASTVGTNADGTSAQTGTLAVYLANLSTTVSAPARFIDATIQADQRAWGNLECAISWKLYADFA